MQHDEALSPKQRYDRERYQRLKAEREAKRAPDPIALLDEPVVAYIAGLTDADGSIYVTHTNRLRTYYPTVSWAMTHRATIDWLCETLGGTKVVLNNHTNMRRGTTSWGSSRFQPQWRTNVSGARAQLLCQRMHSYMITKRAQAELVVAFPVDARTAPGTHLPEEIRRRRMELAEQISSLNRP